MGKVAFDTELGRKLLMFGVLGPVIQRERLTTSNWELLEPVDDRVIGFRSPFSGKLGDQHKPAFALGQCV